MLVDFACHRSAGPIARASEFFNYLKQVLNITNDPEAREEISLSDMIREAVDDYIDKQIKQLKQSERTEG
jgi:hypothetical protein